MNATVHKLPTVTAGEASADLTTRRAPVSVLIPSRGRPERLAACLRSLAAQCLLPKEVIVVWQADDAATRESVERMQADLPYVLKLLHSDVIGIVPAENLALDHASGAWIALIDDDAAAPTDWLERMSPLLDDPSVGAVGGPITNYAPAGNRFPTRDVEPAARWPWYGLPVGNMTDHPDEWRSRGRVMADHLAGSNMALRRSAFGRFEERLRPYWQSFELEVCRQVASRGYKIIFDYANIVNHLPLNTVYAGGRDSDLDIKIFNSAFNLGFVNAKHSPIPLLPIRLLIQLLVGRTATPGVLAMIVAIARYGHPLREFRILAQVWRSTISGWVVGLHRRIRTRPSAPPCFQDQCPEPTNS
jgi:GT2 family glycosyltransferase